MKPILFNTEMVRAILDGNKTATRRIVRSIDPNVRCICEDDPAHEFIRDDFAGDVFTGFVCRKCGYGVSAPHCRTPVGTSFIKPPYLPDEVLYVRETWKVMEAVYPQRHSGIAYKAGGEKEFDEIFALPTEKGEWKPSIHMPKKAARIFLHVTNVRIEKLQSVDGQGILTEGVDNGKSNPKMGARWENMQRLAFSRLWNSTVKPADRALYGWGADPWVWVIEFERIEKEAAV